MKRASLLFAALTLLAPLTPDARAQALQRVPFPDGTGSIGVPAGWQFGGAYRGQAAVSGPGGAAVILGLPWTILRPESGLNSLPAAQSTPIAPAGNVVAALGAVLSKNGARLLSVRGQPLPGGQAPAYLLLYDYQYNGATISALGYFAVLDYGPSQPMWQLYSSAMSAPRDQFARLAPTMLNIWRSWQPNGQAPLEGSASAVFDKAIRQSQGSFERLQAQFRRLL